MEQLDFKEKIWGGIFGVIAILAALGEMFVNGVSASSVLGAIKDISGTLVVVVLLVAVVRSLFPKKNKKVFSERLESAIDEWRENNKNLIAKDDKSDGSAEQYGLSMKTDMNAFYGDSGSEKLGVFLRMPMLTSNVWEKGGINIEFWLNRGTFFQGRTDLTDEQKNSQLNSLRDKFEKYIALKYSDFCTTSSTGSKIYAKIEQPIQRDEEIKKLIKLINSMYQAYLVSANIKVN